MQAALQVECPTTCMQLHSQLTLPLLSTCLAVAAVLVPAVSLRVVLWRLGLLPGGSVLAGCRTRLVVHLRGRLRLPRRGRLVRATAGPCLMAAGG